MKIAIAADIHLIDKKETPARFNAFKNLLDNCLDKGIDDIVLAGD